MPIFNRKYIVKWWMFCCHVSFQGGYPPWHRWWDDPRYHEWNTPRPEANIDTNPERAFQGATYKDLLISIYIIYKILIIDQYNIHLFIYLYMQYIIDISFFFRKRKKKTRFNIPQFPTVTKKAPAIPATCESFHSLSWKLRKPRSWCFQK